MNSRDELRQFHRFLGERLETDLTLDELVAEWKLLNSNLPVAEPPKVPQPPHVAEYRPQPVMDPYELEHFLEHGHD